MPESRLGTHAGAALALFDKARIGRQSRVLDVGGGIFPLLAGLGDRGVHDIRVWDLSATSLDLPLPAEAPMRAHLRWLEVDMTQLLLPAGCCTHWHDRAVLHRLSESRHLRAYARQAMQAIAPGGYALIGASADHPQESIAAVLGFAFRPISTRRTTASDGASMVHALFQRQ